MTSEERFSLRAGCWGTIAGAVVCEALGWAVKNPAYWIVAAVAAVLALGWLIDARSRAEAPPEVEDRVELGDEVWVRRDPKTRVRDGIGDRS